MNKKGIVLFLEIWRNNLFARKMQKGLEHRVKEGMKSNKRIVKFLNHFLRTRAKQKLPKVKTQNAFTHIIDDLHRLKFINWNKETATFT